MSGYFASCASVAQIGSPASRLAVEKQVQLDIPGKRSRVI